MLLGPRFMARHPIIALTVDELAQHLVAPGLENLGIGKGLLVRRGKGLGGCGRTNGLPAVCPETHIVCSGKNQTKT